MAHDQDKDSEAVKQFKEVLKSLKMVYNFKIVQDSDRLSEPLSKIIDYFTKAITSVIKKEEESDRERKEMHDRYDRAMDSLIWEGKEQNQNILTIIKMQKECAEKKEKCDKECAKEKKKLAEDKEKLAKEQDEFANKLTEEKEKLAKEFTEEKEKLAKEFAEKKEKLAKEQDEFAKECAETIRLQTEYAKSLKIEKKSIDTQKKVINILNSNKNPYIYM